MFIAVNSFIAYHVFCYGQMISLPSRDAHCSLYLRSSTSRRQKGRPGRSQSRPVSQQKKERSCYQACRDTTPRELRRNATAYSARRGQLFIRHNFLIHDILLVMLILQLLFCYVSVPELAIVVLFVIVHMVAVNKVVWSVVLLLLLIRF